MNENGKQWLELFESFGIAKERITSIPAKLYAKYGGEQFLDKLYVRLATELVHIKLPTWEKWKELSSIKKVNALFCIFIDLEIYISRANRCDELENRIKHLEESLKKQSGILKESQISEQFWKDKYSDFNEGPLDLTLSEKIKKRKRKGDVAKNPYENNDSTGFLGSTTADLLSSFYVPKLSNNEGLQELQAKALCQSVCLQGSSVCGIRQVQPTNHGLCTAPNPNIFGEKITKEELRKTIKEVMKEVIDQ
jgi:hypothetical protein